jgi:hypothetical protein
LDGTNHSDVCLSRYSSEYATHVKTAINAAINLAALAVSSTVSACGLGEADFSRMKQENNSKAI